MAADLALLLHDDPGFRSRFRSALAGLGIDVAEPATATEALETVRSRGAGILIAEVDPSRPERGEIFRAARRIDPSVVGIAVGPSGEVPAGTAWEPEGILDRVDPASSIDELRFRAGRALALRRLLSDLARLRDDLAGRRGFQQLVGRSEAMERVRERLERLARGDTGVLFVGEPGTGKKHAARTLHAWSARADKPFLVVSCASSPDRLEVELFGREPFRGPGGERLVPGSLEAAGPGTVLLDEITRMPPAVQERLEDALDARSFRRVGGNDAVPLLARMMSTSSVEVARAVSDGLLRESLHRRLAAETVPLPPLRARHGDVILLARSFIEAIREVNALPPIQLAPEALDLLERHDWPGNVGELQSALEQAVILASDGTVRPRDLPERLRPRATGIDSAADASRRFRDAKRGVVGAFERAYLEDLMRRHGGNVTAGAEHAGMLRSALQRLLRKHALRSSDFRASSHASRSGEGT